MAVKHEHIICVQQGDTIRLSGVSKNSSGAPINLTGATSLADIAAVTGAQIAAATNAD